MVSPPRISPQFGSFASITFATVRVRLHFWLLGLKEQPCPVQLALFLQYRGRVPVNPSLLVNRITNNTAAIPATTKKTVGTRFIYTLRRHSAGNTGTQTTLLRGLIARCVLEPTLCAIGIILALGAGRILTHAETFKQAREKSHDGTNNNDTDKDVGNLLRASHFLL